MVWNEFSQGNVNKPLVFRVNHHKIGVIGLSRTNNRRSFTMMVGGSACPFKFPEEPILKEAVKVHLWRILLFSSLILKREVRSWIWVEFKFCFEKLDSVSIVYLMHAHVSFCFYFFALGWVIIHQCLWSSWVLFLLDFNSYLYSLYYTLWLSVIFIFVWDIHLIEIVASLTSFMRLTWARKNMTIRW